MHSFWQRLNAIFFYALSVLGFLSFAAAGTSYWHHSSPVVDLRLEKILLRKIYGAGHDQAILSLSINADLRSVFNWCAPPRRAPARADFARRRAAHRLGQPSPSALGSSFVALRQEREAAVCLRDRRVRDRAQRAQPGARSAR